MSDPTDTSRVESLRARWQALGVRERRAVTLAGWVLAAFLLWSVALQPALRTLRSAPAAIDALDVDLQQMQRLAGEARQLRSLPPLPRAQAVEALTAACTRLGDKARLNAQGDRIVVTFNGIGSQTLRDWLQEARGTARARVVEATLTRYPAGYSGGVVLVVGGTP